MRIQSLHDLHSSFPNVDGFWNSQNLLKTEQHIRTLLPKESIGMKASEVEAVTQLARLFALQGKFKESKDYLDFAATSLKDLKANEQIRPEIRYYLEEGRLQCLAMFPAKALEAFSQAWLKSAGSEHSFFAIDAAYMISITLPSKRGREWLLRAIELAESAKDRWSRSWLSRLYMTDGWFAFDSRNFEKALADFEKAHLVCDASESEAFTRILRWSKARSLRALGHYDQALEIQENLSSEMSQTGDYNGHIFLEIAECFLALQLPAKAKPYFELAFENLKKDKWYSDNFNDELNRIQKQSKNSNHQW